MYIFNCVQIYRIILIPNLKSNPLILKTIFKLNLPDKISFRKIDYSQTVI